MENTNQISNSENNENKNPSAVTQDNNLNVIDNTAFVILITTDKLDANSDSLIKNQADQNDYKKYQDINNLERDDNGSRKLVDEYNINDKAHSDSSEEDFIKTISNFKHANENDIKNDKN